MSISCDCDYDGGIMASTTYPREVTCRTPGNCHACGRAIRVGDRKYMWPMYNLDECKPVRPVTMCEACGDMACNLTDSHFCFSTREPIREQWLAYAGNPRQQARARRKLRRHERREGYRYAHIYTHHNRHRDAFAKAAFPLNLTGDIEIWDWRVGNHNLLRGASPALMGWE